MGIQADSERVPGFGRKRNFFPSGVVLVNPPRQFGVGGASHALPTLGLLYLCASLKKRGIPASAIDFDPGRHSPASAAAMILAREPTHVGLSVLTDKLEPALALAGELKRRRPGLPVLFGGPHINATGTEVMAELPGGGNVDFCFVRESEEALVRFIRGEKPDQVPGIIYRDNGGSVRSNPPRPLETSLDDLPFPDLRDVLNVRRYRSPFFRGGNTVTMMSSRGCPFDCKFCDVHQNMGRTYRLRSPENIVEEIQFHRRNSNIRNVIFKDSIFNLNRAHTFAFCEKLVSRKIGIRWMCNSRVNTVDRELIRLMARSGCRTISFGVESLDPGFLARMRKQADVEDIRNAFRLCRENGVNVVAYMMIGCEGETRRSNRAGLSRIIELDPTVCEFSVTTLYPGTELYREAVSKGFLKDPRWYNAAGPDRKRGGYLALPTFPVDEQIRAGDESYRRFYLRISKMAELAVRFMSPALLKMGLRLIFSRHREF